MQPTGNTLAPSYNAMNPTEQKGTFPIPTEYIEQQPQAAPQIKMEITPADLQPRFEEVSTAQLADMARSEAVAGWTVDTGATTPDRVQAVQTREAGIDTSEKLAYDEIAVDGPAVVQVREAALRDAGSAEVKRG